MLINDKLSQLTAAIQQAADDIGLKFVSGPEPGAYPPEVALSDVSIVPVNGEWRASLHFSVAAIRGQRGGE